MADTGTNQATIIGADTSIKGEMEFGSSARIMGKFEGKITAKGELQVAEGAKCKAEVVAQDVVIDGVLEGDVTAVEKVQLNAKARMTGDLVAAKLVVGEGASFTGHCSVGPDAQKNAGDRGASSVVESKSASDNASKKAEAVGAGRK